MAEESLHEYSGDTEAEDQSSDDLLRDMERDLSGLMKEFHIPGSKFRNLLEVVRMLYYLGEKRREELENLSDQMKELETVCVTEREKWTALQKKKIELEHNYDEEKAQLENEKRNLEIAKISLESKIEQLKKRIRDMEHDTQMMVDKIKQDEINRQELLEKYKREHEVQRSIRRLVMMEESLQLQQRPASTLQPLIQRPSATIRRHEPQTTLTSSIQTEKYSRDEDPSKASILPSETVCPSIQDSMVSSMALGDNQLRGPSLEEEIKNFPGISDIDPTASWEQLSLHQNASAQQPATMSDPVEQCMDLEFDTDIMATERVEVEMMRKENEALKGERAELVKDRQKIQEDKEALESHILELKLKVTHLETSEMKLLKDLQEIQRQRDELLDSKLDDYDHITSKDLYDLLEKNHKTHAELEKTREKNRRLQSLLNKPSWFARIIEVINRIIETPKDSPRHVQIRTSPKMQSQVRKSTTQICSLHTSTSSFIQKLTFLNGWLVEEESPIQVEQLPTWIERIPLKNIKIDRIDSVSMGRVCLLSPSIGQHSRSTKTPVNTPRWCAEVWIAESDGELLFVEVIDLLSKLRSDRTHCTFRIHNARHIQCMKCIPGWVESKPMPSKASLTRSSRRDQPDLSSSGVHMPPQRAMQGDVSTMWIITEDNRLCFYPTGENRHQPIHSTELSSRAFCLLCVGNNALIGQSDSKITVYSRSSDNLWNVHFPGKEIELTTPDHDSRSDDIRCMAVVGSKVWVGCGPFIHLLNAEDLTNERSIYLGENDKKPQDIISLSGHAIVSMSKGSSLFIYEADSVKLVMTFDVAPMSFIYGNAAEMTAPVDIKSIATDGENIFVGTSNGTMVAILYKQLMCSQPPTRNSTESFLKQSSVPVHCHKDKIRNIMHVSLQLSPVAMGTETPSYVPPFKSLIVSTGKGYNKHTEFAGAMEESVSCCTQAEDFQVIVWGHRNQ